MPNRLAKEKNPYLLQHAVNPVDWFPWGDEAFETAVRDNKPVFVSVGYSTCHWCHVMEKESFSDPATAALLNETFVCVKVDREERPDIDASLMAFCQSVTGTGGWPLNVVMTPDKLPFFAATYIPRVSMPGRPGLSELVPKIKDIWDKNRNSITYSAEKIAIALAKTAVPAPGDEPGADALDKCLAELKRNFDPVYGGFGQAPKFPMPQNIMFLLRRWKRTGDAASLNMAIKTLEGIMLGGIRDHAGGGFHRYSTDEMWLVPHFEKMLCDQALLALAFTEAYQATGSADLAEAAKDALDYVLRDMSSPEGGFYSAEDADTDGVEGGFYLWTMEELDEALGDDSDLAALVYDVIDEGNFVLPLEPEPNGRNILNLQWLAEEAATKMEMDAEEYANAMSSIKKKLLAARSKRTRPFRDEKVLCDWNGLMIAALARASVAFDEPRYAEAAAKAADHILHHMTDKRGRILHRRYKGESAVPAGLDDHAFLIWGLLELYATDFNTARLETACMLAEIMIKHFADTEQGGFYSTAEDAETPFPRRKDAFDGAIPSGNSVAALVLSRLATMTGNKEYIVAANGCFKAFSPGLGRMPMAHSFFLCALDFRVGPTRDVVVAGKKNDRRMQDLVDAARRGFAPNTTIVLKPDGKDGERVAEMAEYTANMRSVGGKPAAYVCDNFTCKTPVTDPKSLDTDK